MPGRMTNEFCKRGAAYSEAAFAADGPIELTYRMAGLAGQHQRKFRQWPCRPIGVSFPNSGQLVRWLATAHLQRLPDRALDPRIRVRALALPQAIVNGTTTRSHNLQFLVLGPDFDNLCHGLVAKHVAVLHGRKDAKIGMEIGPAESAVTLDSIAGCSFLGRE